MRRRYSENEKLAALHLLREVGVTEAARRLGISRDTLNDWKYSVQARSRSRAVGSGRGGRERRELLDQLIHEQEIEARYERRTYRHNREFVGEELDRVVNETTTVGALVAYDHLGGVRTVAQRHIIPWLDPTHADAAAALDSDHSVWRAEALRWYELRQAVFQRDGNQCVLCGATSDLTLDHWIPRSKGGPDTMSNLKTMCGPCNQRKGNILPTRTRAA